LIGLGVGLAAGVGMAASGFSEGGLVTAMEVVGGIWLDSLRMTIVPLVFALVVTGVASTAEAARAGRIALKALVSFIVLLWISSAVGIVSLQSLFALWPAPEGSAAALRAVGGSGAALPSAPPVTEFLRGIIPANPIAAAVSDSLLPLVVFAGIFGLAVSRLDGELKQLMTRFMTAVSDAMLVVIGWVMWIGPVGVFALALVAGAKGGAAAVGVLAHYALLLCAVGVVVWLISFGIAALGGGIGVGRFVRETAPAQAVAISTRSSVASLPPMLISAVKLGVPPAVADMVLPMAVSIFRFTGPAMNAAVAFYTADAFGVHLGPAEIAAGLAAAAITTMGAAGVPGEVSFFVSIAPICAAMGAPIEPLALLVAVEMVPDIFRTLGNVSADVAVTTMVGRWSKSDIAPAPEDLPVEA
jgi:Na+/H+-dicarboxylate symporter